ncbi:glycosyltransferase family 2 protein [Blastopirellula retiformator]|uniref:Undecaprenyl-phosphate 4-deoxy-4-formamido-L-arabinose transferase n=1 Tax=Blastopirellula retiformator TaxID=2527970 RepID=A0A5C5VM93_9BACT|nr:glycosyltransferase family 2 protein [Blastopirellula retiformator]TWT39110.1 Undecaprenyl-phosphate 4-deoxy-4-formamido-L-arabinose transferase [Blastopirellula retiformator]
MPEISVIISQRNSGGALVEQMPALLDQLDALDKTFEIIVVDDASRPSTVETIENLCRQLPPLRAIRLERRVGLSGAIVAGIRVSEGEKLVFTTAGLEYPPHQIKTLLEAQSRGDLVIGRRPSNNSARWLNRIARTPRRMLLGMDVRDPGSQFWAARREALIHTPLPRGSYYYLAAFVAMRGYRVVEAPIEYDALAAPDEPLHDGWPSPLNLACAWWLCRRWQEPSYAELQRTENLLPELRVAFFDDMREPKRAG